MVETRIQEFWRWFTASRDRIAEAVSTKDNDWLRQELTPRVMSLQPGAELPRLNWEIGPGAAKTWRFALSPMAKKNISLTEDVVSHAPCLQDWEFCSSKPPKPNTFSYTLRDVTGANVQVNAEKWRYALRAYEEKCMFDVLLFPDISLKLDVSMKKKLGYLIVEGILGERVFIERVAEVEILDIHSESEWPTTELKLLAKHIACLEQPKAECSGQREQPKGSHNL